MQSLIVNCWVLLLCESIQDWSRRLFCHYISIFVRKRLKFKEKLQHLRRLLNRTNQDTLCSAWRSLGLFLVLFILNLINPTQSVQLDDGQTAVLHWNLNIATRSTLISKRMLPERSTIQKLKILPTTLSANTPELFQALTVEPLSAQLPLSKYASTPSTTFSPKPTASFMSATSKNAFTTPLSSPKTIGRSTKTLTLQVPKSPPTFYNTSDVLLDSDSVIIFNRSVYYNDRIFTNPERRTELFLINSTLNGNLKFKCDAVVRNHRLINKHIKFETYWINAQTLEISSNNSVLVINNAWEHVQGWKLQQYRCAARLSIPSRNIKSVIHSRAIILKSVNPPVLQLLSKKVDVAHMQSVRLECSYNTTASLISDFYWTLNGTRLFETEDYKIYNFNSRSLLYIFNIHAVFRNGLYACHVLLTDGHFLNSSHQVDVRIFDDAKHLDNSQTQMLPPETLEARSGEDALVMECWKPNIKNTRWYRLYSSMKELISNESVLLFRNLSARLNGHYECQLEDNFGLVRYYRIEMFVDDNFFHTEPVTFSIIRKNQGTPAKILCHTYPQFEEYSHMASWYRNGRPLESPEDRVYRRTSLTDDAGREGRVIYVAMAQKEDQDFYECIIRKGDTERTQQVLLLIEQTTNLTLKNLNMTIDHVRSCFSSHFDLPEQIDFRVAQFSTFFLVYYNADMSKPLNIIPGTQGAKCTADNHCVINCWVPPYPFDPATTYTFRLSAVFIDEQTVITPLSEEVNATSWDGPASRAVQLNWLHNPSSHQLELRWKRPKILGTLQEYHLELIELDDQFNQSVTNDDQNRRRKFKIRVNSQLEHYILNVSAPFALQLRLIPLTRSGAPSSFQLQSAKDFGYTLVSVDKKNSQNTDASIPPPYLQIEQINLEPKLQLHFDKPTVREYNVSSIRIQYRPLMSLYLKMSLESKEITESKEKEELRNDGKTTVILRRGLKPGTLYQVCVAYERLTVPPTLGFWHCENVPLYDESGQLNPIQTEDIYSNDPKQLLPRPVNCQKANCQCVQSREDHNLVLIKWRAITDSLNFKTPSPSTYVIHYTLNETDTTAEKWTLKSRFYQEDNETVTELRGLFPLLTYRIMIETQNEHGNGLKGTYFSCKAPKNLDLPPPGPGKMKVMDGSGSVLEVKWKASLPLRLIKTIPDFDGYTLHWRMGNAPEQSEFVAGHIQNNVMMGNLIPGVEYIAYLTSHSSTKGDSPLMSQTFTFSLAYQKTDPTKSQPTQSDKVRDLIAADAQRPWYKTLRFRAYLVLAIAALAILLCCSGLAAVVSMKYYDWFQSPQAKERRRKRKFKKVPSLSGISSGRASNASSRLSLASIGSGSHPMYNHENECLISSNIYNLPLHRKSRHKKNLLDMKGGPQGYRPRRQKKVTKTLNDSIFNQRARELNRDPTGFGKSLSEVLADLKKTQEEEVAMIEKRKREAVERDEIELQTFYTNRQSYSPRDKNSIPSLSSSTSRQSHVHRHQSRYRYQRHRLRRKKKSVQAEVHVQSSKSLLLFAVNNANQPPTKTQSMHEVSVKYPLLKRLASSNGKLNDADYFQNHLHSHSQHFCKQSSAVLSDDINDQIVSAQPRSAVQSSSTPQHSFYPDFATAAVSSPNEPLEFHLGANGIERRRLKTTTATSTHYQIYRKKFSAGGVGITTGSLPNLADSGIVYDDAGHVSTNEFHHHTYFHHPSFDCPVALHPIASVKLLRSKNEPNLIKNKVAAIRTGDTKNSSYFLLQRLQQSAIQSASSRRFSTSGADSESAVNSSSGASSHGSGSSNRYGNNDIDTNETSQMCSPQTPMQTFVSPVAATTLTSPVTALIPTNLCAVQICDFTSVNGKKSPLVGSNETWYPEMSN